MKSWVFFLGLIASLLRSTPALPANLTFRLNAEPETLDWNRAHTPVETYLLINLMEGLVNLGQGLKAEPALAEGWKVSDQGKTYTFKLRQGVQWSDGVPLKAQDFVYSWRRLLDRSTAAAYAYLLFDIEGAQEFNQGKIKDFSQFAVHALDDQTLEVRLKKAVSYWIFIPSFWVTFPLREEVVTRSGSHWDEPGKMVTVGPYLLSAHELESKIILSANPRYYGAPKSVGNIDQAVGLIVKDDSTAVTLFESGKLDFMTDVPSLDLERLSGNSKLKRFAYLKTGYLGFNVKRDGVSNPKVRQAIARAIDKSKWNQLLHGGQVAASTFIAPPLMGSALGSNSLSFDVQAAKRELAESGVKLPLKLQLLLPNTEKAMVLAQYIQAQLKENLGIDLELQAFDHKTFRAQLGLHKFPLFINAWSADYPDPDTFASVFLGGAGNNWTEWKNPQYDQLVESARSEPKLKAREKNYFASERILLQQDAVIVPLYYEPNTVLIQERIKGLELDPLNYFYLKKVNLEGQH